MEAKIRYPETDKFQLFVTDSPEALERSIVINEIMYHSAYDENEWIELYNHQPYPIDLSGWIYSDADGHTFTVPEGTTIQADGYFVLALDIGLMAQWYGITNVTGPVSFNLGNGGDSVRIYNRNNVLIDFVDYDDEEPWPAEPDGDGPSLELVSCMEDNSQASNWLSSDSTAPTGTPGPSQQRQ